MKISIAMAKAIAFEANWRGGPVNLTEDANGKVWVDNARTGEKLCRCLSDEPRMQAQVVVGG